MARSTIHPAGIPELGSGAAALKGCVSLIASVCGQTEEIVQYWLDLYYQTRLAYAVQEDARRRDAALLDRIPQVFGASKAVPQEPEATAPAPEAQAAEEPVDTRTDEEQVAERFVTPPPYGGIRNADGL